MKKHSEEPHDREALRSRLIGLGKGSIHKSYYPELQKRLADLERFRALLDQSNEAIFLLELPGLQIADVNDSSCRQLHFSRQELLAMSWADLCLEPFPSLMLVRSLEAAEHGRPAEIIATELKTRSGDAFPVEITLRMVRFEEASYAVAVARDITERKLLEQQLMQVQKLEALGRLAGGIAHDFNNILAAVMGYAELTLGQVPAASVAERNLHQILKASRRARDLVRQILLFSRQADQERTPVDIEAIVTEALKLLRAILPATIHVNQHSTLRPECRILADPTQIHQVLMNLGTNAAHAMNHGSGRLEVRLEETEVKPPADPYAELPFGRYVKLSVSDTGHGMDTETLERIFDPFFTTKGPLEGTGMGLAVVHGIVKSHGGAIAVRSEIEVGTTFEVYLPVTRQASEAAEEPAAKPQTGKGRLLLVDDEEILADLGREMLEQLGYEVLATTSAQEALEAFRASPNDFDLVLTDFTMPHMTGAELAAQMLAVRSDLRIILCTGYSEMISEDKARKMGIRKFLLKPLSIRELEQTIQAILMERSHP